MVLFSSWIKNLLELLNLIIFNNMGKISVVFCYCTFLFNSKTPSVLLFSVLLPEETLTNYCFKYLNKKYPTNS